MGQLDAEDAKAAESRHADTYSCSGSEERGVVCERWEGWLTWFSYFSGTSCSYINIIRKYEIKQSSCVFVLLFYIVYELFYATKSYIFVLKSFFFFKRHDEKERDRLSCRTSQPRNSEGLVPALKTMWNMRMVPFRQLLAFYTHRAAVMVYPHVMNFVTIAGQTVYNSW